MTLSAADRLRQLAAGTPGGLESGERNATLSADRRALSLERLREALMQVVENPQAELGMDDAKAFYAIAKQALERLALDGPAANLSLEDEIGLEAIIETDGSRPSAAIRGGDIDVSDPRLGEWASVATIYRAQLRRAIAATARVVQDGELSDRSVKGTAVMIAPGLALTARHVMEAAFTPHGETYHIPFNRDLTLDFHVEADAPPRPEERIKVTGIQKIGHNLINGRLDLGNLDLAVLTLDAEGPPSSTLADDLSFPVGAPLIHVIGHPKRIHDPSSAQPHPLKQILALIFGNDFGVKRWSPGQVLLGPGTLEEDRSNKRVITHDTSTLPGNSGSPVFDLTQSADTLFGIHYGGYFEKENYAHAGRAVSDWIKDSAKQKGGTSG